MTALLMIVIYIAYVGLGIPDSLFGAVWPAIYREFDVPVSYASFVTTLISCGTIVSSLLSARLINRLGTGKVAAFSTSLTAFALLGFSLSGNMLWLCAFAVPLGLGAGSIDTALNNYVALNCKATHMSFLHCAYGVGVSISPYLMSFALRGDNGWQSGYRTMFFFQLAIAAITVFSLPLWKKVKEQKAGEEIQERVVKIRDILKIPTARASIMVFMGSCAIEAVCLGWGSTFLVNSKGLTPDMAAEMITFYFVGMTVGRFFSGVIGNKLSSTKIIIIGESVTLAAIVLVMLPLPTAFAGIGLFMIGLGNGPLFPNMTHLTPVYFGKEVSQSFIGLQMAMSYVSILTSPVIFGLAVQTWSTDLFPYFQLAAFAITAISTFAMIKSVKKCSSDI